MKNLLPEENERFRGSQLWDGHAAYKYVCGVSVTSRTQLLPLDRFQDKAMVMYTRRNITFNKVDH